MGFRVFGPGFMVEGFWLWGIELRGRVGLGANYHYLGFGPDF